MAGISSPRCRRASRSRINSGAAATNLILGAWKWLDLFAFSVRVEGIYIRRTAVFQIHRYEQF
jgi:hypothetical protein